LNKVEVDVWALVGLACTLAPIIIGAFWTMAKVIATQAKAQIEAQFKLVSDHLTKQDDNTRRLERELLELRAELPRDYVRREDYVQAIAIITTKIDGVMLRMENMFHELVVKGKGQ
jgi:hypothetical protein